MANAAAVLQLERQELSLKRQQFQLLARQGMLGFTLYTFPEYEVNWHHQTMCQVVDLFLTGKIKRGIISAPPRHGKSELVSRRAPAKALGDYPDKQIIQACYSATLANDMCRDVQRIIEGQEYYELYPGTNLYGAVELGRPTLDLGHYAKSAEKFEIVGRRGSYKAVGARGGITGRGANYLFIDDPINSREEAESETYREKLFDWFRSEAYTRLEKDGAILITMTRWHEDDLVGRLLSEMVDGITAGEENIDKWDVFNFPAIKEEGEDYPYDDRKSGEALWPNKYPKNRLLQIKNSVGPYTFESMYQGSPTMKGGNVYSNDMIRYFDRDQAGNYLCYRKDQEKPLVVSKNNLHRKTLLDPAIKLKKKNDPTGLLAVSYCTKNKVWLIEDNLMERIPVSNIHSSSLQFAYKNNSSEIGVEGEKVGQVIVEQSYDKDKINGRTIPFSEVSLLSGGHMLDKMAKACIMAAHMRNERVFFLKNAWWLPKFLKQLFSFPQGKHDEAIDLMYMASTMGKKITVAEVLANRGPGLLSGLRR